MNSTEQKERNFAAENAELPVTERPFEIKKDKLYDIGVDELSKIFNYDSVSGEIKWSISRPLEHFASNGSMKMFNSLRGGKLCGVIDSKGYLHIQVYNYQLKGHRLAFYIYHGWLPKEVDHINGNRSDNRIENLRPCDRSRNSMNKKISSNNKCGLKGVYWSKSDNKYRAQIWLNGASVIIGTFSCKFEAHKAYCKEADKIFKEFSNHG